MPGLWQAHLLVPISYSCCQPGRYLVQELSGLFGQGVVREHAVIAVDAVPGRVVQLTRKITFTAS